MFDLTKEIALKKESYKLYKNIQIFLYLLALVFTIYLSYSIVFPHKNFSFNFLNPTSKQNNLTDPRTENGDNLKNGMLTARESLYLDTNISSDYSKAFFNLDLSASSEKPVDLSVSVRRSYEAFMTKLGTPIGWRDGSLLKNDGNYYLVSSSTLRKFSDANVFLSLGYSENNFQEVSKNDLVYNSVGEDITLKDSYPNDTLLRIDDNYYILSNQSLKKFVSDQAYLSKYNDFQALVKDISFLEKYPISDDAAGFADGTLIANAESVFIVSGNSILPIDNTQTFESKGYDWNNILTVGEDEIAIYQRAKLFNIKSVHPNGTIFKTIESNTSFMILNGQKHILPSTAIAASWIKNDAVKISEKNLEVYVSCSLKNSFWNRSSYDCSLPLDKFINFTGFTFEFRLDPKVDLTINSLNIDYRKNIDKSNFKAFLLSIFNSIKANYAPQTT